MLIPIRILSDAGALILHPEGSEERRGLGWGCRACLAVRFVTELPAALVTLVRVRDYF